MRFVLSVAVLAVVLSACGGGNEGSSDPEPAPTTSSTSSATVPELSLAEVCAELDAAVPDDFMLPNPAFLTEYAAKVGELAASAGAEAQDLLTILAGTTTEAQAADTPFDAGEPFDRGLTAVNEACG